MKMSVIIPSYKRPSDLKRCLAAVAVQTRPADEVLVIGREEDIETVKVVSDCRLKLSTLRIVQLGAPGLIAALNCGLDNATGDLLVFTDDDSEAQADWLERIAAGFSNAAIGAIGGRDWLQLTQEFGKFHPLETLHVGTLTWYGKQYGNHHCPLRGHTKKVMFLKGVNMAFRRSALGTYRIDTALHGLGAQVGSEIDLCSRIRRSGFDVVFDDRILVKHYCAPRPAGDDRDDLAGNVFPDICFNTHYLIAKHFGLYWSVIHLCNSLLLGSRFMPGLLASMKWTLKGDSCVWRRLLRITSAAWMGFRSGRHVRRATGHSATGLQAA
jgi:glycosyltransferase involved in cell wall biosynthesis